MESLSPAKRRLLDWLKTSGGATAGEIAAAMDLTGVAVRQHLGALEEDELVRQTTGPARGRGRPSAVWRLTSAADAHFPDHHGELTVDLLRSLRQVFGDEGLARVVAARAEEQVADYRRRLPARSASIKARVDALAGQRSREGYMAEVVEAARGEYLLVEHHCPICEAARSCTGLCSAELDVFQRSLGDDLEVERVAHLLSGDERCVYRIRRRRDS
ncbi:MAG: metalloregulator ArsR/SmtB family transcription factor [Thermoanaerobaculia bacterium]|nr:metalloregulator ArsR/SmtB family transcription factor [Thermoanaerobaculia bacterium]